VRLPIDLGGLEHSAVLGVIHLGHPIGDLLVRVFICLLVSQVLVRDDFADELVEVVLLLVGPVSDVPNLEHPLDHCWVSGVVLAVAVVVPRAVGDERCCLLLLVGELIAPPILVVDFAPVPLILLVEDRVADIVAWVMFPDISAKQRLALVGAVGGCGLVNRVAEGVPEGVVGGVVVVCLDEVVNGPHQHADVLVSRGGEGVDEMDHTGGRGS